MGQRNYVPRTFLFDSSESKIRRVAKFFTPEPASRVCVLVECDVVRAGLRQDVWPAGNGRVGLWKC